ncbi:hypothetical protein ASE90_15100 [Sphingomonas sp. Leaf67]|uniref:hypothetical protein n=1 Tax=Sphingomonas sp. Leaf67 TaxID=1736230 RepID=UPI0006FE4618|nr:hypothetical protein [Sphingomonas sp. Leaf67]KQN80246.1 hypothetical protein ASE90_15100 [Sphingomonas sp. Leaf67]
MDITTARKRRPVVWCVAAAVMMVTVGDVPFGQRGAFGGKIGFGLAALLLPGIACRPAIQRSATASASSATR